MITARAQRVGRGTFDAEQDFYFYGASSTSDMKPPTTYQQSGPTTSDLAERFTGPSRECMEWLGEMGPSAYDVCSCFAGCASRALESAPKWSTSESLRARQSVNFETGPSSCDGGAHAHDEEEDRSFTLPITRPSFGP